MAGGVGASGEGGGAEATKRALGSSDKGAAVTFPRDAAAGDNDREALSKRSYAAAAGGVSLSPGGAVGTGDAIGRQQQHIQKGEQQQQRQQKTHARSRSWGDRSSLNEVASRARNMSDADAAVMAAPKGKASDGLEKKGACSSAVSSSVLPQQAKKDGAGGLSAARQQAIRSDNSPSSTSAFASPTKVSDHLLQESSSVESSLFVASSGLSMDGEKLRVGGGIVKGDTGLEQAGLADLQKDAQLLSAAPGGVPVESNNNDQSRSSSNHTDEESRDTQYQPQHQPPQPQPVAAAGAVTEPNVREMFMETMKRLPRGAEAVAGGDQQAPGHGVRET